MTYQLVISYWHLSIPSDLASAQAMQDEIKLLNVKLDYLNIGNRRLHGLTDIKTSSFTHCSLIFSVWRHRQTITFLVEGFYSSNCNYFNRKIYTKKKNLCLNLTYRFSELFYRIWFTGWFHFSKFFSFSHLTG